MRAGKKLELGQGTHVGHEASYIAATKLLSGPIFHQSAPNLPEAEDARLSFSSRKMACTWRLPCMSAKTSVDSDWIAYASLRSLPRQHPGGLVIAVIAIQARQILNKLVDLLSLHFM